LDELKAYTTTAEFLVGIGAVGSLGVEHCHRLRKCVRWGMMVGDDHIYPTLTGIDNPLMRLDPTVQGDDKGYFVVIGKVYPLSRNPITFPIPIWHISEYIRINSR